MVQNYRHNQNYCFSSERYGIQYKYRYPVTEVGTVQHKIRYS